MTKNLTFSQALDLIKQGKKVAREGWNGKNMYIYLTRGNSYIPKEGTNEFRIHGNKEVTNYDHIDMVTANGVVCIGWLASQTDMLVDDWQEV